MNIAIVSSTTIPATLPDDPTFFTTYGSEVYNAVLAKGLADRGHKIDWFAPLKSTTFHDNDNINYHPIINSKGAHLRDERLEKICYTPAKTTDLLDYDFLIDMSKQNHITEDLSTYFNFNRYCQYKSGYQDWSHPIMGQRHFVTHCQTFANNFTNHFGASGVADVCRFGIPDFWCHDDVVIGSDFSKEENWLLGHKLTSNNPYYLFPHRPSFQKGFAKLVDLAKAFPDKTFVISTAAVFEDHIREMQSLRESNQLSNLKIIDVPNDINYHRYRRVLMRNATAVLSPFTTSQGYMDTGGLVSFEAIRCGTPVIVTRSPSSEEMLGNLDGKGVEFVGDDIDSLRNLLRTVNPEIKRPCVGPEWMSIDTFVDDYLKVMEKYK